MPIDLPGISQLPLAASVFLILFARVGAILMLLPLFTEEGMNGRARLLLALGMSLAFWGLLSGRIEPVVLSASQGAGIPLAVVLAELLTGLAIGMIVRITFQTAAMAGTLISLQVGLSAAMMFDPGQGGQTALLSRMISVAAVVVCFALGVHHVWIGAIVKSYAVFPVGHLPPAADFAALAVRTAGEAMALAVSLAGPLLVYGVVFNVALSLMARMAPAIQVFFIMQPLNVLLGLALLASVSGILLMTFAHAMIRAMEAIWG